MIVRGKTEVEWQTDNGIRTDGTSDCSRDYRLSVVVASGENWLFVQSLYLLGLKVTVTVLGSREDATVT